MARRSVGIPDWKAREDSQPDEAMVKCLRTPHSQRHPPHPESSDQRQPRGGFSWYLCDRQHLQDGELAPHSAIDRSTSRGVSKCMERRTEFGFFQLTMRSTVSSECSWSSCKSFCSSSVSPDSLNPWTFSPNSSNREAWQQGYWRIREAFCQER